MGLELEHLVAALTRFIGHLGYPGVFVLMALESSCVPIPSEIVLLFAGFLVAQGDFSLPGAIAAGLGGVVVGSTFSYGVGRYGGRPLVLRYGRFVLLNEHRLALTDRWFGRYGSRAVLICRLITGLRAVVSLPAGLVRMSYPRFMAYTLVGSGLWVSFAVTLGYLVGEEWPAILRLLRQAGHLGLVLVLAAAAGAWLLHHRLYRVRLAEEKPEASPAPDERPAP